MELVGRQGYGRPSNAVLEEMLRITSPVITLSIKPQPIGGHIRFRPNAGRGGPAVLPVTKGVVC